VIFEIAALCVAALPVALATANLRLFRSPCNVHDIAFRPSASGEGKRGIVPGAAEPALAISILIPARNEEASIGGAVEAALASTSARVEIVVLDDDSTDRTTEIVCAIAARDARVRLERAPPLPAGWSGKQHACLRLSQLAQHDLLLFVDADVRLAPDGAARLATFLDESGAALVSGFPCEETGSLAEHLVVPMIHFLLLGYLPLAVARWVNAPSLAAGCGQLMLVRREAYARVGGHGAIRASLHDGITLPRAFRRAGIRTDLCDATELARCRMYRGWGEVWSGFSKNATEGMARPLALPVWTVLLGLGHVAPPVLLALASSAAEALAAGAALALGIGLRLGLAARFGQSRLGALLHPVGTAIVLAIQWTALLRALSGRRSAWRGRAYAPQ
jgi:hypothetical protein